MASNELSSTKRLESASTSTTCYDSLEPDQNADSILIPTILGSQLLNNPYSVSIMQQASINLYGSANGIVANKKYVRFKPSSEDQLEQLDSLDLDLFDYPLDYEVIQKGDYYDQGLPAEEIPWYYAVVDPSFIPPPGIQYEILANLYVPADDIYLENEAFRITGNPVESLDCGNDLELLGKTSETVIPNTLLCPEGYHWDFIKRKCVPNNCLDGYHWDGSQCVPDLPPPPPAPQSLNVAQTRAFRFVEENGNYRFKLGIVPKGKGLFMISVGNSTNVYTAKNKCDKADFSLTFKNTNQHLYLYEQSRPGYVLTSSDRGHLYVFKVY